VNVVTAPYRLGNYAGEQGIAAYDLGKETGSSDFEALRLATGVTVIRVTGALDLIEATVGGQKIVGDSDSGLGMQDFSSGWERTLHGVAGGLQLVGTATTFAGSVTRFSSAPRVPGSPPINAVNPELANRLAVSNAAKTTLALPAPRQAVANWGMNTYKHGGEMYAIEHIMYRHASNSGFANVSRFAEGTGAWQIKGFVDDALRYGAQTGTGTFEYNLGRAIGTNQGGGVATGIRVHIRDGNIQTAFPITIP